MDALVICYLWIEEHCAYMYIYIYIYTYKYMCIFDQCRVVQLLFPAHPHSESMQENRTLPNDINILHMRLNVSRIIENYTI